MTNSRTFHSGKLSPQSYLLSGFHVLTAGDNTSRNPKPSKPSLEDNEVDEDDGPPPLEPDPNASQRTRVRSSLLLAQARAALDRSSASVVTPDKPDKSSTPDLIMILYLFQNDHVEFVDTMTKMKCQGEEITSLYDATMRRINYLENEIKNSTDSPWLTKLANGKVQRVQDTEDVEKEKDILLRLMVAMSEFMEWDSDSDNVSEV